jgi:hypothetical protein
MFDHQRVFSWLNLLSLLVVRNACSGYAPLSTARQRLIT